MEIAHSLDVFVFPRHTQQMRVSKREFDEVGFTEVLLFSPCGKSHRSVILEQEASLSGGTENRHGNRILSSFARSARFQSNSVGFSLNKK